MTDKEFCEIETALTGEHIDKVEQLAECRFTGRELKEYLERAIDYYGLMQRDKQSKEIESSMEAIMRTNKELKEKLDKDLFDHGISAFTSTSDGKIEYLDPFSPKVQECVYVETKGHFYPEEYVSLAKGRYLHKDGSIKQAEVMKDSH